MEITVTGTDPEQAEEILQTASDDTEGSENIRCQAGNSLEAEEAAKAGLPLGKYRAYLELLELDPEVTPEEVADLTMREIRSRIDALQGTAAQTESSAYTSDETEPSEAGSEPAEKVRASSPLVRQPEHKKDVLDSDFTETGHPFSTLAESLLRRLIFQKPYSYRFPPE